MNRWFISQKEKVTGPFTSDEVNAQMTEGQLPAECLIWGRPQSHWQTLSWWTKELPSLEQQFKLAHHQVASPMTMNPSMLKSPDSSPTSIFAETSADSISLENDTGRANSSSTDNSANSPAVTATESSVVQLWHYAIDGASKGPLTRAEMINELRGVQSKDEILIWTKGMKSWADLYDFGDLLDELGLNRREHARAPIRASAVIRFNDQIIIGQIKSISEGGFRVASIETHLSIGQVVDIEIKSEQLAQTILAKASVQYMTELGNYGFRFQSISQEAKSSIIDFVLKSRKNVPIAA